MATYGRLTAKEAALTACFTALYVALSSLPMFQIIGFFGKTITAATIIAPVIGIILGAHLGVISTFLGGIIGLFFNPLFSQPSLAAGVVSALCASLLYTNRRSLSASMYIGFLLAFGLYPSVGPAWLYLPQMWFQIAGLFLLISPLQSVATKNLNSSDKTKLLPAFFVTSLTSTLAGQIAGSLVYEAVFWPNVIQSISSWELYWKGLTFLYPFERTIIALLAAVIGASIHRVLRATNLLPLVGLARKGKA